MTNKRQEAIEKYSQSIKGQFDPSVESAHITGFMAGYDAASSKHNSKVSDVIEDIDKIMKKPFTKEDIYKINMLLDKNPHRGSSFNEYKYECLMEDAKKLIEALENVKMLLIIEPSKNKTLHKWEVYSQSLTVIRQALKEFKANWDLI